MITQGHTRLTWTATQHRVTRTVDGNYAVVELCLPTPAGDIRPHYLLRKTDPATIAKCRTSSTLGRTFTQAHSLAAAQHAADVDASGTALGHPRNVPYTYDAVRMQYFRRPPSDGTTFDALAIEHTDDRVVARVVSTQPGDDCFAPRVVAGLDLTSCPAPKETRRIHRPVRRRADRNNNVTNDTATLPAYQRAAPALSWSDVDHHRVVSADGRYTINHVTLPDCADTPAEVYLVHTSARNAHDLGTFLAETQTLANAKRQAAWHAARHALPGPRDIGPDFPADALARFRWATTDPDQHHALVLVKHGGRRVVRIVTMTVEPDYSWRPVVVAEVDVTELMPRYALAVES